MATISTPPEAARRNEIKSMARLASIHASNPAIARKKLVRGESLSVGTSIGVQVGLAAACCVTTPHSNGCWWWNNASHGCAGGFHGSCWCPGAWWWWGCSSFCWPYWGSYCGFGYWFNTCGFWGYGSPYYCAPYAYYCAPEPVYYTYIVEDSTAHDDTAEAAEPVAYESEAAVGESRVDPATRESIDPRVAESRPNANATRAANDYLTLGDRAFRDGRFSDAVYAYAKAVELVPDDGVFHLILSDALFATGDYHYCAYALRRAIELDPKLVESVVDKRGFYGDPREFDRQLALLERYVEDHFLDDDARLVLAANYLFSNRPDLTADLLQSAFSSAVRDSVAGRVIASRAQSLRATGAVQR